MQTIIASRLIYISATTCNPGSLFVTAGSVGGNACCSRHYMLTTIISLKISLQISLFATDTMTVTLEEMRENVMFIILLIFNTLKFAR